MRNFSIAFFLVTTSYLQLSAQLLPHKYAPGEEAAMPAYTSQASQRNPSGTATPPPFSVRCMAEWEEIQSLVLTWDYYETTADKNILAEIIRNAQTECEVIVVWYAPDTQTSITNFLTARGITTQNVRFVETDYNRLWVRDYGANTIYANGVDSLYMVDWIYNRPRPQDDVVPAGVAAAKSINLYETTTAPNDLIHTGGNFMTDGLGTMFSSNLVLDENPNHNSAEIDQIMHDYMGTNRYIKMPTLPYDGIHHIDMHMKLLDEETLLLGEYPQGTADGPQIEANLQYILNNYNSVFGTPYKVIRIPQPPDGTLYPDQNGDYRTYTNAVFVNKTVLLPSYNSPYDTTALRIWRDALPGYRIVQINCNSLIQYSGAIHCITNSIGVNDPLLITHQSLRDVEAGTPAYHVEATIQHRSGIQSATLYYRLAPNTTYIAIPMQPDASQTNVWTADIAAQSPGSIIQYYIEANANSGKAQVRPLPAPDAYWHFKVLMPTGLELAKDQQMHLNVFPNPSYGLTAIKFEHTENIGAGKIYISSVLGEKIQVLHEGDFEGSETTVFFDASTLPVGLYLVVVESAQHQITTKLMIK